MNPWLTLLIVLYFVLCAIPMFVVDREEYIPIYPLFFPMAFLIFTKTNLPAWLKCVLGIFVSVICIGTVIDCLLAICLFTMLMVMSDFVVSIWELFRK